MSDGLVALDAQIRKLRALPDLAKDAAPEVAEGIESELKRQIGAGTAPDGTAWRPTQEGKKPLKTAAGSLSVGAIGPRVLAVLRGHVARHHHGRARGGITRQVLPTKMTAPVGRVIKRVLAKRFTEHMGGK